MKTSVKNPAFSMRTECTGGNPLVNLFGNDFLKSCNGDNPATIPSIHIKEKKDIYKIEMTLPGFHKKDFNVYVEGNMLVISCKKESRAQQRNCGIDFARFLSLPDNVDSNRITAKYNGMLKVNIPKKHMNRKRTGKHI